MKHCHQGNQKAEQEVNNWDFRKHASFSTMTFCSSCGKELNKTDIFCPTCGTKSESQNGVKKTVDKKERLPLSFSGFKASREKERAKHFGRSTKGKSKRKLVSNEDLNETVKVNVEIMLYDGHELKSQHGKSLLLSLKKSANTDDLLNTALNKHKAHSKNLIKPNAKYVMLYPNVLHKYKMECNKPYHRITFFLCLEFGHSMASLQRCLFDDCSSDDLSKNYELAEEESLPKSRSITKTIYYLKLTLQAQVQEGQACQLIYAQAIPVAVET